MDVNANVFSNKEITVTYEPRCCVNAGICARQLSEVFRNSVIPWIDLDGASNNKIISGMVASVQSVSHNVADLCRCPPRCRKWQLRLGYIPW